MECRYFTDFEYAGDHRNDLLPYVLLREENLENAQVDFSKNNEKGASVNVEVNNLLTRQIPNYEVLTISSGVVDQAANQKGTLQLKISKVKFPFSIGLWYQVIPDDSHKTGQPVTIKFEIKEPGNWNVQVVHQ